VADQGRVKTKETMDEITQSAIQYSTFAAFMLIWICVVAALVAGLEQVIAYFRARLRKTS
jgi:hypothetical protein